MTMHCIKVCREKKITYLSFARSTNHNQDCKINEISKINVVHRMCPNEILQTKSRDKSLYILQKSPIISNCSGCLSMWNLILCEERSVASRYY